MLVTGAVTAMVVLAFLIPLAMLVRDFAGNRAINDAQREAERFAQLVALNAGVTDMLDVVESFPLDGSHFPVSFVVDDVVVGTVIPPGEDLTQAKSGIAFRAAVAGGQAIYAPVIIPSLQSAVVVRVFVSDEQLSAGVTRSWRILGALGLVLVLIALAVADRLGRSIVEPVRELSANAALLGEGALETRVTPSGPPEVREVGVEFNRLAERMTTLLRLEREAAADMSHRLRTPLTALRLDLDAVADGSVKERLRDDLDELERTVDFVIQAARRPGQVDADSTCELGELTTTRVEFWSALAEEQGRAVSLEVNGGPWQVAVGEADVVAMIDALLGNVMAHTSDGVGFAVEVDGTPTTATLTVADDGPGFDPSLAERGRSSAGSTGLGLDIVRRTAEASGGSLSIESLDTGGGRVVVTLGLREAVTS